VPERGAWRAALCLALCLVVACAAGCGVRVQPKGQVVTGVSVGSR
jgi:hypothetical protein